MRRGFRGEVTPYIEHPLRVALRLVDWGVDDPQVVAAALLHDTVEDCRDVIEDYLIVGGTAEQWVRLQFGERIASMVAAVTNNSGQRYEDKIRGLVDYESTDALLVDALLVKASDLVDNAGSLSVRGGDERTARLARKYSSVVPLVRNVLSRHGYAQPVGELTEVMSRLERLLAEQVSSVRLVGNT